jgi:hypothetical protein
MACRSVARIPPPPPSGEHYAPRVARDEDDPTCQFPETRAQGRGDEKASATGESADEHDACVSQRRTWLLTPLDLPEYDEAVDDAGDEEGNPAAADNELRPGHENEGSVQARILLRRRDALRDRKRFGAESQLVCALPSSAHQPIEIRRAARAMMISIGVCRVGRL